MLLCQLMMLFIVKHTNVYEQAACLTDIICKSTRNPNFNISLSKSKKKNLAKIAHSNFFIKNTKRIYQNIVLQQQQTLPAKKILSSLNCRK